MAVLIYLQDMTIRKTLTNRSTSLSYIYTGWWAVNFAFFRIVTAETVKYFVNTIGRKVCELDPVPASVLLLDVRRCKDILLPVLKDIINISLQTRKPNTSDNDRRGQVYSKKHRVLRVPTWLITVCVLHSASCRYYQAPWSRISFLFRWHPIIPGICANYSWPTRVPSMNWTLCKRDWHMDVM